jgi:formamidopyrimidine-DNA glycosylase
MPELPEVTITVNGLQKVLPKLVFIDVWTDLAKKNQIIKQFQNTIKNEKFFDNFKKRVIGAKIINVERRAKNILINISGEHTILIHLKMTGHLLYGKYIFNKKENKWTPDKNEKESLSDPFNRFIHVVFTFSNGKHLAFCDSRKFGKVTIIPSQDLNTNLHLKNIGPEPLEKSFSFQNFKTRLFLKPNGKIKTVLMDQSIIAGIGNIYSDEMLWLADIYPESNPKKIPESQLLKLYNAMKNVLTKSIGFGGDSMSDYRDINGEKGTFQNHHNVYKKKGTRCVKKGCRGVIMRKVINSRGTHFCNIHQKLFN